MNKILILLVLLPTVLFSQEFSIESFVNYKHVKSKKDYSNLWKFCISQANVKRNSLPQKNRHLQIIKFQIPDSLTKSVFKYDIGDSVTQILNGRIVGKDQISSFEFDSRMQAGSNERIYFKLSNLLNRHENWWDIQFGRDAQRYYENYYFYVISHKSIDICPSNIIKISSLENIYLKKIYNYLLKNQNSEQVKYSVFRKINRDSNLSNFDTLRVKFDKYCHFHKRIILLKSINCKLFIIKANPKYMKLPELWNFSFLFSKTSDLLLFIPNSNFEFSFKLNDEIYFVFREFKPNTGIRGRNVYKLDLNDNSIIKVFSEWSWST